MSNPDSFINEVTEEVRRDRLFALFRRYGWIAVLAVLLLVGGTGWNEWRKIDARRSAQAFGEALLAAVEAPDAVARQAALAAIAEAGERGAVARLVFAADILSEGDEAARGQAIAALREVAADASLSPALRDLAALRLAMAETGTATVEERRATLRPLTEPGRPYRVLAEEQLALLALEAGDREGALAILRALTIDQESPPGLRRRAGQAIVVLGGAANGSGG
ncbi:MAG: tetratricopeptide repeat protein [Gemmobacter sp.]